MTINLILHQEEPVVPLTALSVSEQLWSHGHHDAERMSSVFTKSLPYSVAFSIIAAGLIFNGDGTAKEILTSSITAGFSAASLYLVRTAYEARSKLNFMQKSFDEAAKSFRSDEERLTSNLKEVLYKPRPKITEMVDLKKYPIRTLMAFSLIIPAAFAESGQGVLLSSASLFFLMGVLAHEQNDTADIGKKAGRAHKYIKTINKMKLQGIEI